MLAEQVGAVDVNRIGDPVKDATTAEMWGMDDGLLTVLGLR